jgi:hypothetical protein
MTRYADPSAHIRQLQALGLHVELTEATTWGVTEWPAA